MLNTLLKTLTGAVLAILPYGVKKQLHQWLQPRSFQSHNPINDYSRQLQQQLEADAAAKGGTLPAKPSTPVAKPQPPTDIALRRSCNLIMVTAENNNKFYKMLEKGDGTFDATYGRVGSVGVTETYPIAKWDAKYQEKIRKGYRDHTALFAEAVDVDMGLDSIPQETVRELIRELQSYARRSIRYHYNVNSDQVTPAQVREAQALIDTLAGLSQKKIDPGAFNDLLLQLYAVIPRKMKNVQENLAQSVSNKEDIQKIQVMLANEQATLDVMRSQVEIFEKQREETGNTPLNLLEILGLELTPVKSADTIHLIKKMMQEESGRFVAAYSVRNRRSESGFRAHLNTRNEQHTELFWHGSRNENWMSILENGLILRPANAVITGKMFGYGLYFADRFRKSLNYSSIQGSHWAGGQAKKAFMAIFKVHIGKPLQVKKHETWHSQITADTLAKKGQYDSIFALKGFDLVNNEYIVYHENQCTIQFLVEIK